MVGVPGCHAWGCTARLCAERQGWHVLPHFLKHKAKGSDEGPLRARVDFASVVTIDWVHCMLADGVFLVESHLLMTAAEEEVSMSDLESDMKKTVGASPQQLDIKARSCGKCSTVLGAQQVSK